MLHKTLRSTEWRNHVPNDWRSDTVVFTWNGEGRAPPGNNLIVQTEEETLGGKRNAAVKYARANNYDLIAFLDGDDLFGPSWISGLCEYYDVDKAIGHHDHIYHPQWSVLFDPTKYVIREHIGQLDPRFDSRDMMFYNPWSALCAFNPLSAKWKYREHKKTDKKFSFEDWSFNLDTWCDGQIHVVVPDTYHFLRMRMNSLGKSTIHNTLEHTKYFKSPELIQKKIATAGWETSQEADGDLFRAEMAAMATIEPEIYYWRVPEINQQYNNRAGRTADLIADTAKRMPFARDVFWMHDHKRIGGAEKALAWVAEFLDGFKDSDGFLPNQVWIDDAVIDTGNAEAVAQWGHGVTHLLRVWAQEGKQPRSLHICNTGPGWQAFTNNPALFDDVQVYLYVFNDDLMFPNASMDMAQAGYHSPIYNCADIVDRPNVHLITDSDHYSKRLADLTGLGDKIRKIAIPVRGMPNKRKKEPNGKIDILWAGRLDHFKGIDELLEAAHMLYGQNAYRIHVYGDGQKEFTDKLIEASSDGRILYGGRYDGFENIPGEYDFFLFTSEREGQPNVVREAVASGLRVLCREAEWTKEAPVSTYVPGDLACRIDRVFDAGAPLATAQLGREACEPLAIAAYKECLV